MRLAECDRCGGGIGFKGETLCHRCRAADREAARRAKCGGCGEFLRLDAATGRCVRCSRNCVLCGHPVRSKTGTHCRTCRVRSELIAAKLPCPRCGRPGFIRSETGWCGPCSRPPNRPLPPRPCAACGALARKKGEGLCHRCWTRSPSRPVTQAENLMGVLDGKPEWLARFAEFATERHCVARACLMVSAVGRLAVDGGPTHPQAILERSRRPGRSAGALARTLEEFLVGEHLAFGLDQQARLAHGRRQRRVDAAPATLRPAVQAFAEHLVSSQERARRAGTRPRADNTIEQTLGIVRDLAIFLSGERAKHDWATVDVGDVEAFLGLHGANRRRRLHVARQFFRWAHKHKLVLVDPTRDLPGIPNRGFTGPTLTLAQQRQLFRRWTTDPDVHPHEALVGLLALLHATANRELRNLHVDDYEPVGHTLRVGRRPRPVPLDPVSVAAVQRCLSHRAALGTRNPHLIVTAQTKTRSTPASEAYLSHVLDPAGAASKHLRSTRILDLVITLDPKVVGEALGMQAEGLVDYLADHVDPGRLTGTN